MRKNSISSPYTKLHPEKTALLVIDVQNDFAEPEGAHPLPGAEEALNGILKALEIFRKTERPVVRIVRLAEPDGSNVDMCRRELVERGKLKLVIRDTWGAQPVPSTLPDDMAAGKAEGNVLDCRFLLGGGVQQLGPHEYVMYKPRFNAFVNTGLKEFLKGQDVDSVILVGFTFPNCVRATQLGATDLDFRVGLIPEACTQVDASGLDAMRNQGVQIMEVDDVEKLLRQHASAHQ